MSLSTCVHCGGFIPIGPEATNCCEDCGAFVFGKPSGPDSIKKLEDMIKVRNTLIIEKNQRITNLETLLLACREQVDVEDRYVHDLTPIIEAMEALEETP